METTNKQKEVVLTQAQFNERQSAGTLQGGVIYKISDASLSRTELNEDVNASLTKADGAEQVSNKTTVLDASSTDASYPSAKAVYDTIVSNERVVAAALNKLNTAKEDSSNKVNALDDSSVHFPTTHAVKNLVDSKQDVANIVNTFSTSDISTGKYPSSYLVKNVIDAQSNVMQVKANLTTTIDASSTDASYPSAKAVYTNLDNKVDKVSGKGLSTNDYTTAEKTKLAGAEDSSNKENTISSSTVCYPTSNAVKTVTDALGVRIDNISTIGRFLSTWDTLSGMPYTDPSTSLPYEYHKGDYYVVGFGVVVGNTVTVDGVQYSPSTQIVNNRRRYCLGHTATSLWYPSDETPVVGSVMYANPGEGTATGGSVTAVTTSTGLKPDGSQYSGTASNVSINAPVLLNDIFMYDSTNWILLQTAGKDIVFANIGGEPSDNALLGAELDNRVKLSGSSYQTINGALDVSALLGNVTISDNENLIISNNASIKRTSQGTITDFLQSGTGQSTYVTMTQKAITDSLGNKEDSSNKVTELSSSSTDAQYPSAKAVYDTITNNVQVVAAALNELKTGKEDSSNKVNTLDDSSVHFPTTHAVKSITDLMQTTSNLVNTFGSGDVSTGKYPSSYLVNSVISGISSSMQVKSNLTTTIDASSTDSSYPSAKAVYTNLDNKVDKVSGKGLSTNDYTTTEKTKLAGIAEGATANEGTVTSITIKMNDSSKGTVTTSGTIDLGTVITSHQDISGKEDSSNKVKSVSSSSTDTQYPSAKAVYTAVSGKQDIANLVNTFGSGDVSTGKYPSSQLVSSVISNMSSVMQVKANMTTTIDASSTDSSYPSAKAVYDVIIENEEIVSAALNELNTNKQRIPYIVTYEDSSTYAEMAAAVDAGRDVYMRMQVGASSYRYIPASHLLGNVGSSFSGLGFYFMDINPAVAGSSGNMNIYVLSSSGWSMTNRNFELTSNKVDTLDDSSVHFPTTHAVKSVTDLMQTTSNLVNTFSTSDISTGKYPSSYLVKSVIDAQSSAMQVKTNMTTTIDASSTDSSYPSAKAVYTVVSGKLCSVIEKTYSELSTLKSNSQLVPGQQYKITDYTCTTVQDNTTSAGHLFDIIVVADDESHLNENARACHHAGDSYFSSCDLESWELKYCLDNDTDRFAWADSTNGKGVIYYMKDEFNNECPYDFKNIQFYRKWNSTKSSWCDIGTSSTGVAAYTFSSAGNSTSTSFSDLSLNGMSNDVCNNIIKSYINSNIFKLNNNCIFGSVNHDIFFEYSCYNNTLKYSCQGSRFGYACYGNVFDDYCYSNIFNSFCEENVLGYGTMSNVFDIGLKHSNFGQYCYCNVFKSKNEYIILGNNCEYNTFESYCNHITTGNNCSNNKFNVGCSYIKFCSNSTGTAGHYFSYNNIDSGVKYVTLYNTGTASSSSMVKNYHIKSSLVGSSSSDITIEATRNNSYDTTVAKNSSGTIKTYCEADLIA